ncbi:NAD-dependent epimerase/dehydratase family protein [Xanthobacteraceae bacterium Astr-EGSB]|uniref:NAD-dependent epimerase/dehydratase family protein n=1 Tax=Astrobacterium formosum TaxID=3069710 RepID=UPI0027AEA19F|nr:NAD-dependent epimerase/dehydratase family protein [Xanthobacteraceae bacterium Astr-EGSB]
MTKHVLITGGAGFIGSHIADLLLRTGHSVRVLDNLTPQVHGDVGGRPHYLDADAELVIGDVRDRSRLETALDGIDAVIHLAAAVGVGQSMYDIVSYVQTNDVGTAVLLEALSKRPVERLVVASSMSVYGEGLARRMDGTAVSPKERGLDQLRRGDWELRDRDGEVLRPIPTPESKQPALSSVYALNKYTQERMALIVGKAYGISTVALRFFNVYGPRQALSNPYTGVLAIFAARLLNSRPPLVFEDGLQQRDFVHVSDVARACLLALTTQTGIGQVFNIGSGQSRTVISIADDLARVVGMSQITPRITAKYRSGDIRHCFADISQSRTTLGYSPQVDFRAGLEELAAWLEGQLADDKIDSATAELERRGLVA